MQSLAVSLAVSTDAPLALDVHVPLDVQLLILSYLDGPSLGIYAECCSRQLSTALRPFLGPFWMSLYDAATVGGARVPGPPPPEEPLAFVKPYMQPALPQLSDGKACKSTFVQANAALQRRCPRCGRGGRHGDPLNDLGRSQRHLCDFFK